MKKNPIKNVQLKVYGNMHFDVADQPVSSEDLPVAFRKAKILWDQNSEKNFAKIVGLLNPYLKGLFLPFNINNWSELFVDEDGSGMPEYLATDIQLRKICFKSDQFIPNCGVEAIFSIPVTPRCLNHQDLLSWQEENDFFFNGLMFGWEIPRNEKTEDLDFMADGHTGCECIVNYQGCLS